MKSHNSLACEGTPVNGLMPVAAVADLIRAGACLSLAGRKAALDQLPAGQWIAGTSPYFMTGEGGRIVRDDEVFVTDLGAIGTVTFATYDSEQLDRISGYAPDNGMALAIIPAGSRCHIEFAQNAGKYPMAFMRPTVGWISGYDLERAGHSAWVYDGMTGIAHSDRAAVAHITQPDGESPAIEIVNIFEPDGGDEIRFEQGGFSPATCLVNGEPRSFAEYLRERGRDTGDLPLVGNFGGARLNASIQSVEGDQVTLYAPVFPGVAYAFAAPVADYAGDFRKALETQPLDNAVWSCNCILNFLFGKLDGVQIGGIAGPVTFGEIAYQLLNQTMVIVRRA